MHLEILIEDVSGKKVLETLLPKIIGAEGTFRIHAYRGIGRIPRNMKDVEAAHNRILLDSLPKLLKGYGKTFKGYPSTAPAAVVLVCDLDDEDLDSFLGQLNGILKSCNPAPTTRFCIAIEEGEAWLLGDIPAVKEAYPNADDAVLNGYVNDSVCGTWETLANAVYQGGEKALSAKGWQAIGAEKSRWAENIAPRMNIESNRSNSFTFFRQTIRALVLPKDEADG